MTVDLPKKPDGHVCVVSGRIDGEAIRRMKRAAPYEVVLLNGPRGAFQADHRNPVTRLHIVKRDYRVYAILDGRIKESTVTRSMLLHDQIFDLKLEIFAQARLARPLDFVHQFGPDGDIFEAWAPDIVARLGQIVRGHTPEDFSVAIDDIHDYASYETRRKPVRSGVRLITLRVEVKMGAKLLQEVEGHRKRRKNLAQAHDWHALWEQYGADAFYALALEDPDNAQHYRDFVENKRQSSSQKREDAVADFNARIAMQKRLEQEAGMPSGRARRQVDLDESIQNFRRQSTPDISEADLRREQRWRSSLPREEDRRSRRWIGRDKPAAGNAEDEEEIFDDAPPHYEGEYDGDGSEDKAAAWDDEEDYEADGDDKGDDGDDYDAGTSWKHRDD